MFICGQVYCPYIQAWRLPDSYRTNLNLRPLTRFTKEVIESTGLRLSLDLG